MIDYVITNGFVIDGTAKAGFYADVGIDKGKIAAIGTIDKKTAHTEIDASGCVVCPGFIDMHSHADISLPVIPTADSLLHQGITTIVFGQCGFTPAPLLEPYRDEFIRGSNKMLGHLADEYPWNKWNSFGEFLQFLENMTISCNVVPLVGQGTIRNNIMGFGSEAPSADQISHMRAEVTKAMDAGAFGISSGLIYPPGCYTSTDELIELTRIVGERGGFYFSHIRGEKDTLLEAIKEAIQIGRETGASVQISHFKAAGKENWDRSAQALRCIEEARAQGIDVSSDMYPYLAGSTSLATMLPEWAHVGGPEATFQRLRDPETRARMAADMKSGGFAQGVAWDSLLITESHGKKEWEGRFISELSAEAGKSPFAWLFEALIETGLGISMAIFGMSEENRRQEIRHPFMMIGTDGFGIVAEGPLAQGKPHPRSFGAFPRVLGQYVREEGLLSLEGAIHKMTGLPAAKLDLMERGTITENSAADLVIFDQAIIDDAATYEDPLHYAEGIIHVIVNGRMVVKDSHHTGARPGIILKRNE